MSTAPRDGEPLDDPLEPASDGESPSADESKDGDHADAMGIDEEDPIDATLVGKPVDDSEDSRA